MTIIHAKNHPPTHQETFFKTFFFPFFIHILRQRYCFTSSFTSRTSINFYYTRLLIAKHFAPIHAPNEISCLLLLLIVIASISWLLSRQMKRAFKFIFVGNWNFEKNCFNF
jgi:hypothetical protein